MKYFIAELAEVDECTIASGGCPAVTVVKGYVDLDVNHDFRHQAIIDTYHAVKAEGKKTKKLKAGK